MATAEEPQLKLPLALTHLIEKRIWPTNVKSSLKQHRFMLTTKANIQQLAPDEEEIYFYTPPFIRMLEEVATNIEFWEKIGAIHQLKLDKCLLIGDFGLGSDAPIILDYSLNQSEPSVKRLEWSDPKNYWEIMAPTFQELSDRLNLNRKRGVFWKHLRTFWENK